MSSETKHMVKKNTLVPALRFKEFDGVWMENTLGNLFTFKNGLNSDKEKYGSGIKFINVLDIIGNNVITYDSIIGNVEVTDKELEKNEVIYGDVLFQRSSETREEVGQANIYVDKSNNAVFGGFVIRGRKKQDYDPYFINYLLKTSPARKEITTKSGGSTRYNVGQESLSQVFVTLTSLPEQQKIASFLSAVDEKIQQLTKKKELLEHYKKGVMQQLFSGKLRFKDEDGKNYPDWEARKLGAVLKEFVEKTTESNQYPILSSTKNDIYLQSEYFTRDIASKDNAGYKVLKRNQLVFSPQNLWLGNINLNVKYDIGIVSPSYKIFDFKNDLAEVLYFKDFLQTNRMMYEYAQASEQGASVVRRNLDMPSFKAIKIQLPCLEEQQKIATYLSRIDSKIESVNQQITQTQTFKKGLLQQLFV